VYDNQLRLERDDLGHLKDKMDKTSQAGSMSLARPRLARGSKGCMACLGLFDLV